MHVYTLEVSDYSFNTDLFPIDYPGVSFSLKISVEAENYKAAAKIVRHLLLDKKWRWSVAQTLCHNSKACSGCKGLN